MEREDIFKIFVLITIAAAFIGQAFSNLINQVLWAIIFPSLLLSWIIGLIIEGLGGDILEDYYCTIELDEINLSVTISLFWIVVFAIKVFIF